MGIDPEVYEDRYEFERAYFEDIEEEEDMVEAPRADGDIDGLTSESRRLLDILDLDIPDEEHEIFYEDSHIEFDEFDEFGY